MNNRPDLNRRAIELVNLLTALARRAMLRERSARSRDIAMTPHEFRVIAATGEHRSPTMSELAQHTLLSVSSLTSVADRLVAKRLVVRERSEDDRRVVRVRLTRRGRGLCEHFRRHRLRMAHAMLSALSEREQGVFIGLMRKIGSGAQDSQPPRDVAERGRPPP
jgi:DNA-binding MarR family transcriptional regulator